MKHIKRFNQIDDINESFGSWHDVLTTLKALAPDTSYDIIRPLAMMLHDTIKNREDMDLIYSYIRSLNSK